MTADITRFKRRVLLAQAVSGAVLLFGVVAMILYFDPSLLGVPPDQYPYYKGTFIWLGVGPCSSALASRGSSCRVAGRRELSGSTRTSRPFPCCSPWKSMRTPIPRPITPCCGPPAKKNIDGGHGLTPLFALDRWSDRTFRWKCSSTRRSTR